MSTSFISYENQICPHWFFFSVFHHLRQLLLWSLVIKDKNVLSSKIKFRKHYWISNKNNNVTCDRLIFYYSIQCFFVFNLYKFHVFCRIMHFDAPENLRCVWQQGLIDIKHHKFLILFIIPRETLYSPKAYLPYVNICKLIYHVTCLAWSFSGIAQCSWYVFISYWVAILRKR